LHTSSSPPRLVSPSLHDALPISARDELIRLQRPDGSWELELEADCTIPAEYIMMMHFLGELDSALEAKLAAYLRQRQAGYGGWPDRKSTRLNSSHGSISYAVFCL